MSEHAVTGSTEPNASGAANRLRPSTPKPFRLNGCAWGCLAYLGFAVLYLIVIPGDILTTNVVMRNRSPRPVWVESVERSWANGVAGSKIKRLGIVNAYATARFTIPRAGDYYRLRLRDKAGKLLAGRAVLRKEMDEDRKRTTWEVEWDGTRWTR